MAEPTPSPAQHPPRWLFALYVLLPLWAATYLFVVGGLVQPEVHTVARTIEGVSRGAAAAPDGSEQVLGILAAVPQDARDDRPPRPVTEAMLAEAKSQYDTLCAVCHGPQGRGDGPAGAALNPRPLNFHFRAFQERMPPGATHWVIKNGLGNTPRRSGMPAFGQLSDDQIWALVEYVRRLGRQP
jgi:mono/diheme cytochrome c family protein